jgi:opacity protein-like surface antigen
MRRFLAIAAVTAGLLGAAGAAQAQDRLIDGALGAGAGALVGGPIGAVAGGVIGYSAGPQIDRTLRGGGRKYRKHHHHRRHHSHRRHHHR